MLYEIWDKPRRGRAMPARGDWDILDVPLSLWGHMVLLDVLWGLAGAPPRLRYRVYGTMLAEWRRADLTGRFIDDPERPTGRAVQRWLLEVALSGRPSHHIEPFEPNDRRKGWMERIALPLSQDGRRVDMILGAGVSTVGPERA
ncbi:MAG: hypothetical protein OHK0024_14010 [Thalassobaculales bacterium]